MSIPDVKVVEEVPASMQKLARLISKGFYGVEHSVLIDLLIRYICVREDDLRELLRFDTKQLRAILISLKTNKIIKERQLVEQRGENMKAVRHNYYFINYRALLSVMKYKIDHMRRKLESEEKTSTHRSTFKCIKCSKPYSDLDINDLWNGEEMQCIFCRGVVEEDSSALPSQNARSSLARFNEQMMPFFQLMQELDGIQLAVHLLEPRPAVIVHRNKGAVDSASLPQSATGADSSTTGQQQKSSKNEIELYKTGFTVNIEHNEAAEAARIAAASTVKQVPVWIQSSTLPTTSAAGLLHGQDEISGGGESSIVNGSVDDLQGHAARKVDIASALLRHETRATESSSHVIYEEKEVKNDDDDFEEVNDEMNDDDEEEDENDLEVKVKGKTYTLADVMENPDLIEQMSPDEKEHYVKVSQAAYEKMYGE